jgi:hypothetical protein
MKLIVETIPVDARKMEPCSRELCDLDATVRLSCDDLGELNGDALNETLLCTGHAHVIIAEAMLGL